MKRLVLAGITLLALLPAAVSAANYKCSLPSVTGVEFKNGAPSIGTYQDSTVEFVVRGTPDGKQASIEGATYLAVKGAGYQAFIAAVEGISSGIDVLTIYDSRFSGGQFAVETRNVVILGKPVASQMVGVCAAL